MSVLPIRVHWCSFVVFTESSRLRMHQLGLALTGRLYLRAFFHLESGLLPRFETAVHFHHWVTGASEFISSRGRQVTRLRVAQKNVRAIFAQAIERLPFLARQVD